MKRLAALVLALALAGAAAAQNPTPEPTPTPTTTPTPDPAPPPGIREDGDSGPTVTSQKAPDDYRANRDRGTVRYDADRLNYSFHRVLFPAVRPIAIAGVNFTQGQANTVVFWGLQDQGLASTLANAVRVRPGPGHIVTDAEIGMRLRLQGTGVTRGVYVIVATVTVNGVKAWVVDRAPASPNTSGMSWQLIGPIRDFTGITFVGCNLRNVWLPSSTYRPTVTACNTYQSDLDPETP